MVETSCNCNMYTKLSFIPPPQHLLLAILTRGKAWKNWSHAMTYLDVERMHGGVAYSFCTVDCLMSSYQSFYGLCLQSVAHSLVFSLGMCHSSTRPPMQRPGTSLHMISLPGLPPISIVSNKRWGGKAWAEGYATLTSHPLNHCLMKQCLMKQVQECHFHAASSLEMWFHCH